MKDRLKQAVGNVVTGERFWDRETDLELLTDKIDEGANILLVAQRRIGKTSVLAELHERLRDRYTSLFVDLEAARSSPDAIAELSIRIHGHRSLWEKTKEAFANVLGRVTEAVEEIDVGELGVKIRSGLSKGNWQDKGDQIFRILAGAEKPVVLMLDEVPIMVNFMLKDEDYRITPERRVQADEFLSWVRKNTIEHQGKVRTIISGSIGLEPILRQARLSATINHFVPFELKPWDEETAKGCIKALAKEYGVTLQAGVPEEMVKRLGCCIPHHVQMFFSHIHDQCKRKGKMECSVGEVGGVYEKEMLGVRGHAELTHYEERLEMVLGKELFTLAIDMLTEAAVSGCLTKDAIAGLQKEYTLEEADIVEAQKEVIWVLEHDGYLIQSKEGHVFVSKLLRDWWKNRHEAFFTPVLERGA
ncbi:MAG TPA: hypothetical protein VMX13_01650 [Sedimentisphaerales bacterium]|nr:hypothetical protein [Sedimentisphaerales bacterium]